jgi:hypothetical protein
MSWGEKGGVWGFTQKKSQAVTSCLAFPPQRNLSDVESVSSIPQAPAFNAVSSLDLVALPPIYAVSSLDLVALLPIYTVSSLDLVALPPIYAVYFAVAVLGEQNPFVYLVGIRGKRVS